MKTDCSLNRALGIFGKPISSAVKSLRTESKELHALNAASHKFKYESIASVEGEPGSSGMLESGFNLLLGLIDPNATVDNLLTNENDLVVSLKSQIGDATSRGLFKGYAHTKPNSVVDSPIIAEFVECSLLNKETACPTEKSNLDAPSDLSELRDIDLTGRSEVDSHNIRLENPPNQKIRINQEFDISVYSEDKTLEDYLLIVSQENQWTSYQSDIADPATFSPKNFDPIEISVLATFTDNTYAFNSFEFNVEQEVKVSFVDFPEKLVVLRPDTVPYNIQLIAYLKGRDTGSIDVSSAADYRILGKGSQVVEMVSNGTVRAIKPGTARIKAKYKNHSDVVEIVVFGDT